jgi:NADPH2:quinone reductase
VAEEGWLARVPDNLPLEQAAGVPLVALTAWQALHRGNPQTGQHVLITAASGGVGHVAVQVGCCCCFALDPLAGWQRAVMAV